MVNITLSHLENNDIISRKFENHKMFKWMEINQQEKQIYDEFLYDIFEYEKNESEKILNNTENNNDLIKNNLRNLKIKIQKKIKDAETLMRKAVKNKEIPFMIKQPYAFEIKYPDFPKFYSWSKGWKRRKSPNLSIISRLYAADIGSDYYYLRIILLHIPGIESYENLYEYKDENGEIQRYNFLKQICMHHNLVNDNQEYFKTMEECVQVDMSRELRLLYCTILSQEEKFYQSLELWEKFKEHICMMILFLKVIIEVLCLMKIKINLRIWL